MNNNYTIYYNIQFTINSKNINDIYQKFQLRYSFSENKKAAKVLMEDYEDDILGKIALELYRFHRTADMVYSLDADAEELFEDMFDKYNGQFNMKYSGMTVFVNKIIK